MSGLYSRSAFATALLIAGLAHAAVFYSVGVHLIKRMSVDAVRFRGVTCGETNTAQEVHPSRDGFQVGRIDAGVNPAQVVKFKSFRDRTDDVFIGPTIGLRSIEPAISVVVDSGYPEPAACAEHGMNWTGLVHLGPKAISGWACSVSGIALVRAEAATTPFWFKYGAAIVAWPNAEFPCSASVRTEPMLGVIGSERRAATFALSGYINKSHCRAASYAAGCGQERAGVSSTDALRLLYAESRAA